MPNVNQRITINKMIVIVMGKVQDLNVSEELSLKVRSKAGIEAEV
jgi:hypothetical protein